MKYSFLGALLVALLVSACKKEVEVIQIQKEIVEVEKRSSWTEMSDFVGNFKILLGLSKTPNGLYFQQPYGFGGITTRQNRPIVEQYIYDFPTDISVRVPLGANYFVTYYDSLVAFTPTNAPILSGATEFIYLKRLDKQARRVRKNYYTFAKFGAINRNDYLLFAYETAAGDVDNKLRFILSQVTTGSYPYSSRPKVTPKVISIPLAGSGAYPSYPSLITAIDDYFLVDCGKDGVYRIQQDGTWKQVINTWMSTTCFYKWQDRVYILGEKIGYSTDNGNTWTFGGQNPDIFHFNTYHVIGDSLVGVFHGTANNKIFTRKITDTQYKVRLLKDDGLRQSDISGLESWGDTVYIATTSGMFKRPLAKFFESK